MKVRIFTVIAILFTLSCGSTKTYDYNNITSTEGLMVTPSFLSFSTDNETHSFALHFAEKDLFLLSIDYTELGADFKVDLPITANDCRQNISTSEKGCVIPVRYIPQASGVHSGKIILNLIYVQDQNIENQKTKKHELKLIGTWRVI